MKKNNEQFYKEEKTEGYPERNFGIYNIESGVLPRDETHTTITKIIKIKFKKSNFDSQMAEVLKSLGMPQGCGQNAVRASGGRWTPILQADGDNNEEMTSTSTKKCK